MTKVFIAMKLIIALSLISMSFSFGVMIGAFTKNPFGSRDRRFNSAYSLVTKRTVQMNGGYENAKVYPIAAYRQVVNGINYKIVTAIKDEKNMKVHLVASDVYSGPFNDPNADGEPTLTSEVVFPETFIEETEATIKCISEFLSSQLFFEHTIIKKITSVLRTHKIAQNESFYLVNLLVEREAIIFQKYIVLSMEEEMGFKIMHTIDFPRTLN